MSELDLSLHCVASYSTNYMILYPLLSSLLSSLVISHLRLKSIPVLYPIIELTVLKSRLSRQHMQAGQILDNGAYSLPLSVSQDGGKFPISRSKLSDFVKKYILGTDKNIKQIFKHTCTRAILISSFAANVAFSWRLGYLFVRNIASSVALWLSAKVVLSYRFGRRSG